MNSELGYQLTPGTYYEAVFNCFIRVSITNSSSWSNRFYSQAFPLRTGGSPSPSSYSITFNANGGEVSPSSKIVTNGETYGELPTPYHSGYDFDGWFTEASGGVQVTSGSTVNLSRNQTLYAHWTSAVKTPGLPNLTYGFSNSYGDLGYSQPYYIPLEGYKMMFGDTTKALSNYYLDNKGQWGGSCFGFATTSGTFFIDGNDVSTTDFRSNVSVPYYLQIMNRHSQWNITVREFLEAMQISQRSDLIREERNKNWNKLNELCEAVSAFERTGTIPVDVDVFGLIKGKRAGHSLLPYKIERISATSSRMLLYDCNFPNQVRQIDLTTDASGNYTGWYYHLNDSYNWGSAYPDSDISFIPYSTFYKVWANRGQKTESAMNLLTVNANVVIKDFEGNAVATLSNGKLTTTRTDIYQMVTVGVTADNEFQEQDTMSVWLPVSLYELERTDDYVHVNGTAVLMDADTPFEASVTHVDQSANISTTASGFAFVVDDSTQLNRVIFNEDTPDGTYDIMFHSTLTGEHEDVQIAGNIMAQLMTFGMANGQAEADADSLVSIHSYLVNGVRTNANGISDDTTAVVSFEPNGGGGFMSARRVAEDGIFTLPLCEFTAPSPNRQFIGWLIHGEIQQPGASVSVDSDIVATAQWSDDDLYAIRDVTVNGNNISVSLFNSTQSNITVAVAVYSEQGQMLCCTLQDGTTGNTINLTLDTDGAAYLKVFLLDSQTYRPLSKAYKKDLR